jgi:hypothetical protein
MKPVGFSQNVNFCLTFKGEIYENSIIKTKPVI